MTELSLARICARCGIERKHVILIVIFLRAHPETSIVRGIWDFVRGHGSAAVAAGRAGVRSLPHSPLPACWTHINAVARESSAAAEMPLASTHESTSGAGQVSAAA